MDLNELLYQQQRAVAGVRNSASDQLGSRFDLVNYYGRRIRDLQRSLGAIYHPAWLDLRAAR